jgi:ATP-dependent Lon protease
MTRGYIECVLDLPWAEQTQDDMDIAHARSVLDRNHFGMEKVKDRILEYLAVQKLTGKPNGQILCLVGPPGVGKTSIVASIAESMGRKFVRMSLGGIRDEAEIRGHRRTYIGAMPGRIIAAMRQAGSVNPVLLFDEIDKLASDYRGDPAAAMLEVLTARRTLPSRIISLSFLTIYPKPCCSRPRTTSRIFPGRCWTAWRSYMSKAILRKKSCRLPNGTCCPSSWKRMA